MLNNDLNISYSCTHSSFLSEEAFVRAALSDGDRHQVQCDVRHGHSVQAGESGGPHRGRVTGGLGLSGHVLLPLVPQLQRDRHAAQTVSPHVSPLVWIERAGVGQACVPRVSLRAAGFGRDRGLLLEPLGQLEEAVVRRLSVVVVVQPSGHFGLLHHPAPFGVRLCRAASLFFIIM